MKMTVQQELRRELRVELLNLKIELGKLYPDVCEAEFNKIWKEFINEDNS